jgi:peptidyl-prolyl cis-trans isomerase D
MLRLSEHLPVALKPLDDVRVEIVATLNENLARENAEAQAEELLVLLTAGDSGLEALATEAGLEYGQHEALKRNSFTPDATLVQGIFRLQAPAENDPIQMVLPSGDGFAVIELESVVDGVLEEGAPLAQRQYERVLANSTASQEAFAMMRQLRANADVEVYEERIQ